MIKERKIEIFGYNPEEDIEDANLVFEDFNGANGGFNSFWIKTIIKCLSTELEPEAEAMVVDGFRKILLEEETEWYIFAIQSLPGILRTRLRHYGAQIIDDYDEDEVDDEMTAERKEKCKRVKEVLGGCEADLVLSWKERTPEDEHIWFGLTMVDGEEVDFEVNEDETIVEVSRGLSEGSIKYILTWDNKNHTKIRVRRTRTFTL